MADVTCPYCKEDFEWHPDEGVDQDSLNELECPECEKNFVATAYWDLVVTGERKAPCLNGKPHSFKSVCRFPLVIFGKVSISCEWCDKKEDMPWKLGPKYGYELTELEANLIYDPSYKEEA
jgi:uncharacterized Zn-finger protein